MGIDPKDKPLQSYNDAEKQMNYIKEISSIKNIKSIDFNLSNDEERDKILKNLPEWINTIIEKLDPNDKWMVFYKYHNAWRSRKLDEITCELLRSQVAKDCGKEPIKNESVEIPGVVDVRVQEEDYDFMPIEINQCEAIRIVNFGNYNTKVLNNGDIEEDDAREEVHIPKLEDDETYKAALASGNQMLIKLARENWKKQYRGKSKIKRTIKSGGFWKWICKLPINLERYMIFNELDSRTAALMEEDNCLIYACKQYGLSQDIIDHMKDIIKVKHFSLSKLKEIAADTGITFIVEEKDGRKHIQGDNKGITIPLLLFENHYMLNERVKISPYYIKHIHEINADKNASKWDINKKQIIDRLRNKNGRLYYSFDQPDYPLKLVLKTIFECNGFEPIKMGSYITYASSLYKYKLDPIDTLEYNPKFCCRLKEEWRRKGISSASEA